jgi:ribulose-5-phosphate 4-epimerase/fuculose-1-phosphate aldolase
MATDKEYQIAIITSEKADLNQYKLKMLLYILRNHGFLITKWIGLVMGIQYLA